MATIEVAEPWFTLLRSGAKRVEGRKGTAKWSGIQPGDVVVFGSSSDDAEPPFKASVVAVRRYLDPTAFLAAELALALPGVRTVEEGREVYLQWWSEEDVAAHGVLAIEVEAWTAATA